MSLINDAGKLDIHIQRIKLELYLTSYTQINSKCVRPETIKLVGGEKNRKKCLLTLVSAKIFWMKPKSQETKAKLD